MDEVSQLLLDAAEVMSERGLHKRSYVNPVSGREVCLMGALHVAAGWTTVQYGGNWRMLATPPSICALDRLQSASERLRYTLLDQVGRGNIPWFNDRDETTVEDAVLLLKRAAEQDDSVGLKEEWSWMR